MNTVVAQQNEIPRNTSILGIKIVIAIWMATTNSLQLNVLEQSALIEGRNAISTRMDLYTLARYGFCMNESRIF